MSTIVTLGELMLRLSTPGQTRFVQTEVYDAVFGGGEANVAVSLANFGHDARFVTKLPAHEIGQAAVNALARYVVDTRFILRGGDRIGIYFLETGVAMRPSKVLYDRAGSAIATADANEFDWDAIFAGASWFHWSGITPALGKKAAELTKTACIAAKQRGVTVSCDLNYRRKLWTPVQAQTVMKDLMRYVDVCIGNEEDAELTLGFKASGTDVEQGKLDADGYRAMFFAMKAAFGFRTIASTLRESHSATHNGWSAAMLHEGEFFVSKHYDIDPIVDRVGGGDAFSGGLIHGLLTKSPAAALEFAVAASALKHTVKGDFNLVDAREVEALAGGDSSGRIQR